MSACGVSGREPARRPDGGTALAGAGRVMGALARVARWPARAWRWWRRLRAEREAHAALLALSDVQLADIGVDAGWREAAARRREMRGLQRQLDGTRPWH